MSSDDLTSFLEMVTSDADQETMTHDPEDCADWRNSCTAHNTLRLAAMVRGVLDLTRDSSGDDLYPSIDVTVGEVREAITRELTGKEDGDGLEARP
jgi:hypothetical protein